MPKICGIYRISSPSGAFYIGSSFDVHSRWSGHKSDLRKERHHCQALQRAARKYGIDSLKFELLMECGATEAREIEQAAIEIFKPEYNSSQSTFEALSGLWRNPAFRAAGAARASERMRRLQQCPQFQAQQRAGAGRALAELHTRPDFQQQHIARATPRLEAINRSPELKAKAAAARNATYDASPEKREARSSQAREAMLRLHEDKEMQAKVAKDNGERLKALRADPEARKRNAASIRKAHSRPVECIETGVRYDTAVDAAEALGIRGDRMTRAAREGRAISGQHWRYL